MILEIRLRICWLLLDLVELEGFGGLGYGIGEFLLENGWKWVHGYSGRCTIPAGGYVLFLCQEGLIPSCHERQSTFPFSSIWLFEMSTGHFLISSLQRGGELS
jgi:hypothetical protein